MAAEDQALQEFLTDLQSGKLSFADAKRRYVALGKLINDRYALEITALSLDVVHSREVKASGTALEAQATFDAYHRWVLDKLNSYGCRSYTWSGDGLMAMFQKPEPAVAAARALIDELPDFNRTLNLVARDLQIRAGVHTGPVLPHEEVISGESTGLGKVASDTFDCAGHLQKAAAPNRLLISGTTHERLAEGAGSFAPMPTNLPGSGTAYVYPPQPVTLLPGLSSQPPQWSNTTVHNATAPTYYGEPPRTGLPIWIWGAGAAAAALAVLVAVLLLNHSRAAERAANGGFVPAQPAAMQPVAGSGVTPLASPGADPAAPVSPGPTANPPAPAVATAENKTPAALSGQAPDRRPWASPDAASGVPTRLAPSPRELRWLVCIGVERYRDKALSAEGAEASVKSVAQALQTAYGVGQDHTAWLANEQATAENIKGAFSWIQQKAGSGRDTVIVYLAGAATVERDRPDFRHPGGSGYVFLPADANPQDVPNTGIYGADMAAWLGATHAQTVVLLADTPNAGALEADVPQQVDQGRQFVLAAATGAAQRMASGKSGQPSAFADGLAAALRGEADRDRDRRVSMDELAQYLRSETSRRTGGAQTPEVKTGYGGYMPELYLAGGI